MDNTDKIIEERYDVTTGHSRNDRNKSGLEMLRKYNNWVKACLINKYVPEGASVLDFCGGKGGDLKKFDLRKVNKVVSSDISGESVKESISRHEEGRYPFEYKAFVSNCFEDSFIQKLRENGVKEDESFDAVSCQFAIHYCFQSEETARKAIHNIARNLKRGCYFIGTTVNAYRLVKKIRSIPGYEFSRSNYFRVQFEDTFDKMNIPIYGAQYKFFLADSVENIPESLIPFSELQKLCHEEGLELEGCWDLHKFYEEFCKDSNFKDLFNKMNSTMPYRDRMYYPWIQQWEIIGYYIAFAFKKQ